MLAESNGPYDDLPVDFVWWSNWVRFGMADCSALLEDRFLGGGNTGPINGQMV